MKSLLTWVVIGVLMGILLVGVVSAQSVPALLNVQGKLTDTTGNPVADGSYSVMFTIYDAATGGTALWAENQVITTSGGLFSVMLGESTSFPNDLFDVSSLWLGIKVESDPEMTPRQRLTTAPYAFRAANTATGGGWIDGGGVIRLETSTDSVGVGTSSPEARLHVVGDTATPGVMGVSSGGGYTAGVSAINTGSGPGLYATSTSWHAILGVSDNGNATVMGRNDGAGPGVKGQNQSTGPAIVGYANTGNLLELSTTPGPVRKVTIDNSGNIEAAGMIQSDSGGFRFPDLTVQTTAASHSPTQASFGFVVYKPPSSGVIAYGTVTSNGTLYSGTSNLSVSWNSSLNRYEITITGEDYYYLDYVTIVTPSSGMPCFARTNSMSGKLLVYLYEAKPHD